MRTEIKCSVADCLTEDSVEGYVTRDYLEGNGWTSLVVRLAAPGGEESREIWFCASCRAPLLTHFSPKETAVPAENTPERIDCANKDCKSVFHRPQDASESLSTADVAQLRGWTLVDREKGLLHCAWGHKE